MAQTIGEIMLMSVIKADFIRKHPAQTVLTVLGLSGVLLIFLPFTGSYIPAGEFLVSLNPYDDFLVLIAPCVILPFVISIGYLRWLLIGPLSRGEKITGYVFALLAAYSVLLIAIAEMLDDGQVGTDDFYFLSMFGVGPLFGALFVILNIRNTPASVPNALVAMQVAYLPFTIYWLLVAIGWGQEIGWYLAIVTVLVYSTQIVMVAKRIWYALIFFIPLILAYTAIPQLEF